MCVCRCVSLSLSLSLSLSRQVRALLSALAGCILMSDVNLSGQGIADALYGLSGMTTDCPELRSLLSALAERIDETQGKLDSQEIGNALYGLQALSSDMTEARLIAGKLAEKLKRSKAVMLSQHIGRAILGFQRLGPESAEVRALPLFLWLYPYPRTRVCFPSLLPPSPTHSLSPLSRRSEPSSASWPAAWRIPTAHASRPVPSPTRFTASRWVPTGTI